MSGTWKLTGTKGTIFYMGDNVCNVVFKTGQVVAFNIKELPTYIEKIGVSSDAVGGIHTTEWEG